MADTVTLTKKEFDDLTSGLCTIRDIARNLEGVLSEEITGRFKEAIQTIDGGLVRIHDELEAAEEAKRTYYESVQRAQGFKTVWEIFDIEVGQFNTRAFTGEVKVAYSSRHDVLPPVTMTNPNWLHMWQAADTIVRQLGPTDRIFIEGFEQEDGYLRLILGS